MILKLFETLFFKLHLSQTVSYSMAFKKRAQASPFLACDLRKANGYGISYIDLTGGAEVCDIPYGCSVSLRNTSGISHVTAYLGSYLLHCYSSHCY